MYQTYIQIMYTRMFYLSIFAIKTSLELVDLVDLDFKGYFKILYIYFKPWR